MSDLSKYTEHRTVLCVNILIFSKGKYFGIGGKVEPEESYFKAAKRELKEETGLK